jgi:predicted GH43/DUF377 family glycosyl hydrolase
VNNPVLYPLQTEGTIASWETVLKYDSEYYMYYSYRPNGEPLKIGLAKSTDGLNWNRIEDNPVLENGTDGEWDDADTWCSMVWIEGSTWYMIYTATNETGGYHAIGWANSSDGETWYKQGKLLDGSVGAWDALGVENYGLIKVNSTYYLWYNTLNIEGEWNSTSKALRKVGLATTEDSPSDWNITSFVKDENNPLFTDGRFCVFPFKRGGYYYLLVPSYVGIDKDHSSIELYRDTKPTFYPEDREFLGFPMRHGSGDEWDSGYLDTPFVLADDVYRDSFDVTSNELWVYYAGTASSWATGPCARINLFFPSYRTKEKFPSSDFYAEVKSFKYESTRALSLIGSI